MNLEITTPACSALGDQKRSDPKLVISNEHGACPPSRLTTLQRAVIKTRIQLGFRLYRYYGSSTCRIGPRSMVKSHSYLRFSEVANMRFISMNTTIPVPRVYDFFFVKERAFLVMEFIDAPSLDRVWSSMTDTDKQSIISQLKHYLAQMRELVPPHPGRIEAADGSPCCDPRQQDDPFGPFATVSAFHTFLGHDFVRTSERYAEFRPPFEACAGKTYRTMFTHGDLAPRNILVKGGRIVAIIDWETAGWYPEYWEYARLTMSNHFMQDWKDALHKQMEPYLEEAEAEDILSSIFTRG